MKLVGEGLLTPPLRRPTGLHFGGLGTTAAGMACKRIEQALDGSRALRAKVKLLTEQIREAEPMTETIDWGLGMCPRCHPGVGFC